MTQHAEHITPVKVYIAVGISLLILTGLTVTISFIDLGPYNITIALIIASIKALLVAFFFMHIFWDNKLYLVIFSGALLFLTIFLTLTMFDTETRGSIDEQKAKPIKSEAPIYQNQ
jgi:cytochrome c oxidase subunit 4